MSLKTTNEIDIVRANSSKINDVDFDNLSFGSVFTDHMLVCDFKEGQWGKPVIKPYEPFMIDPSAKVFHYGQAIFEGMKAYKDDNNDVWLFRPDENYIRFNKSAVRMAMPEVPENVFIDGLKTILEIDQEWVKKGLGNTLYIRPFMIAIGSGVIAQPSTQYRFMIILSPAKSYYSGEVKVIIAEHYSRAANGGIGAAKAAGNYSAQFYPQKLAQEKGFQQIIWTDDATHTKLEEAGTMNLMFMVGSSLVTAPTGDTILDGVTRKSVIQIAKDWGIDVQERQLSVKELVNGILDGSVTEAFGAGTAAVIAPIQIIGFDGKDYQLPDKKESDFSSKVFTEINQIRLGEIEDTRGWVWKV